MPNKDVILYLDGSNPPPVVVVTEADTAWTFRFTVMYQNAIYAPNVANVILAGHKPDGNAFAYAGSKSGNVYQVGCNVQMTAVPGDVLAALHLLGGGNTAIPFILRVQPGGGGTAPVASASALTAYATILNRIGNFPPNLSQYVTDWLDEHTSGSGGAVVDNTLNIPGAAADAKTTGDRIRALESKTIETDDTLMVKGAAADAKAVGDILGEHTSVKQADLWEQGSIGMNGSIASNTKIRMKSFLSDLARHVTVKGAFSVLLYEYNNSDSLVGWWNGTTFEKVGNGVWQKDFDIPVSDGFKFKLVLKADDDSEIETSAAYNVRARGENSAGLIFDVEDLSDDVEALRETISDLSAHPALPAAFVTAFTDFLNHLSGTFDSQNGDAYISALMESMGSVFGISFDHGVLTISPNTTAVTASQNGDVLLLS